MEKELLKNNSNVEFAKLNNRIICVINASCVWLLLFALSIVVAVVVKRERRLCTKQDKHDRLCLGI
jgi:hypothetical protein